MSLHVDVGSGSAHPVRSYRKSIIHPTCSSPASTAAKRPLRLRSLSCPCPACRLIRLLIVRPSRRHGFRSKDWPQHKSALPHPSCRHRGKGPSVQRRPDDKEDGKQPLDGKRISACVAGPASEAYRGEAGSASVAGQAGNRYGSLSETGPKAGTLSISFWMIP